MSRTVKRTVPPAAGRTPVVDVKVEEFARTLERLMLDRNWSQSDLARAAFGTQVNPKTGREEVTNRDRVSMYIRAKQIPDKVNAQRLADALGVRVEELMPDIHLSAVERDNPSFSIVMMPGDMDRAVLRVNVAVPWAVAMQIRDILAPVVRTSK